MGKRILRECSGRFVRSVIFAGMAYLCMIIALGGCGENREKAEAGGPPAQKAPTDKPVQPIIPTLTEDSEGASAFALSIDEFIAEYNGFYEMDYGTAYLPPAGQWQIYTVSPTLHCDVESTCYAFSENAAVRSLPTLAIHTPGGKYIRQIIASYDDHSYTPQTYERYEEMCCYMLKIMLPEVSDASCAALLKTLHEGLEEGRMTDETVGLPYVVYHRDGVGIYGYCAAGESIEIRVVPMTDEIIEEWASYGVRIEAVTD